MESPAEKIAQVDELLDMPELVRALETEQFKSFLDHVPIAILVARFRGGDERIVYANREFARLSGREPEEVERRSWSVLDVYRCKDDPERGLGAAVRNADEFLGTFCIRCEDATECVVQAYTSVLDDDGEVKFRLVALVDVTGREASEREQLEREIREKDTLLRELQHRVKNNLALITALIRLEARQIGDISVMAHLDRLAGRIESLSLLYQHLANDGRTHDLDLGAYLSQIAAAVMRSHAPEGVRLNMQVDPCPVSVNIGMPVGLIVNEVMTNALKHAFTGRAVGAVTLTCLKTAKGCDVTVADDGVGMPLGAEWPKQGRLGALIVQSLRENANAELTVESAPGRGTRVVVSIAQAWNGHAGPRPS